jgi:ergothioneine biosynthesis protein EgtB
VWAIIEHEEMHQETLAYMWHRLPYASKVKPEHYVTLPPRLSNAAARASRVTIPAGTVMLGTDGGHPFAWDNERPATRVHVDAFSIDTLDVTNADFMRFVDAGGYADPQWWRDEDWTWVRDEHVRHPSFWEHGGGTWYWLAMFERVPLPMAWPVYVTWAEANAYARWRGARLLTEAEFIRAADGASPVNDNFARFDPLPVGIQAGASTYGAYDLVGNGWEWTADVFAPFDGFMPLPSYPEYSADFFDGQHFVMKGASPMTARGLVRPGFRNWFRPRYPYVYATFRCVTSA